MKTQIQLYNFEPGTSNLYQEVLAGLRKPVKEIPTVLVYDEYGSECYDKLCEAEDYYPTRTELSIMQNHIWEMVALIGEEALLVEYGSGSSFKTRLLLDHLPHLAGYIPIDISKDHLLQAATETARRYPHIEILPVCADYKQSFTLPSPTKPATHRVAYFSGSTIGLLRPHEAVTFLKQVREMCGPDGGFLIAVDLKKDIEILHRAYNDSEGVGPAGILNALTHTNRKFNTNFNLNDFEYLGHYNEMLGCIEMGVVSRKKQMVNFNGELISLDASEKIHIMHSYKYSLNEFAELVARGGWQVKQVWTDENEWFSVQYLI